MKKVLVPVIGGSVALVVAGVNIAQISDPGFADLSASFLPVFDGVLVALLIFFAVLKLCGAVIANVVSVLINIIIVAVVFAVCSGVGVNEMREIFGLVRAVAENGEEIVYDGEDCARAEKYANAAHRVYCGAEEVQGSRFWYIKPANSGESFYEAVGEFVGRTVNEIGSGKYLAVEVEK